MLLLIPPVSPSLCLPNLKLKICHATLWLLQWHRLCRQLEQCHQLICCSSNENILKLSHTRSNSNSRFWCEAPDDASLLLLFLQGNMLTSNDTTGALCISQPWPGMARTIHNDHQRFVETYCQPHPGMELFLLSLDGRNVTWSSFWNTLFFVTTGYFFTGDGAYRSKEGYYQITGRLDDVINVSGHRIGTAEIEDVLVRLINV